MCVDEKEAFKSCQTLGRDANVDTLQTLPNIIITLNSFMTRFKLFKWLHSNVINHRAYVCDFMIYESTHTHTHRHTSSLLLIALCDVGASALWILFLVCAKRVRLDYTFHAI